VGRSAAHSNRTGQAVAAVVGIILTVFDLAIVVGIVLRAFGLVVVGASIATFDQGWCLESFAFDLAVGAALIATFGFEWGLGRGEVAQAGTRFKEGTAVASLRTIVKFVGLALVVQLVKGGTVAVVGITTEVDIQAIATGITLKDKSKVGTTAFM
jgi:hypothetical protein